MLFDLNNPVTLAVVSLASIGLGEVVGAIWRRFKPEPPPKKKPWTVSFTAPDGRPMLGYMIDEPAANRLMGLAQYEYDSRFR